MGTVKNFLLCSFVVAIAQPELILEPDRPFLRVRVFQPAELRCCYSTNNDSVELKWVRQPTNKTLVLVDKVELSDRVAEGELDYHSGKSCGSLSFKPVQLSDSGLYHCWLRGRNFNLVSHGTYLQVTELMEKTINLSEGAKNKILIAEGVLLLLCVLLPSFTLLCQSKKLMELEKKKAMREEENIYQGLNLDDCQFTYDQIERSQAHGPYQDVGTIQEEEEEIQLEKP